jgi:hypothetical protein
MDTLTISKQMADGLKRLASKRQKADTAATSAREDFLRAVEVARAEGATVEEIGQARRFARSASISSSGRQPRARGVASARLLARAGLVRPVAE